MTGITIACFLARNYLIVNRMRFQLWHSVIHTVTDRDLWSYDTNEMHLAPTSKLDFKYAIFDICTICTPRGPSPHHTFITGFTCTHSYKLYLNTFQINESSSRSRRFTPPQLDSVTQAQSVSVLSGYAQLLLVLVGIICFEISWNCLKVVSWQF